MIFLTSEYGDLCDRSNGKQDDVDVSSPDSVERPQRFEYLNLIITIEKTVFGAIPARSVATGV